METAISRTSNERIIRACLLAALLSCFSAAFLWDGYVRYPRENLSQLAGSLGLDPSAASAVNRRLTAESGRELAARLVEPRSNSNGMALPLQATYRHGSDAYYVGAAGWLRVMRVDDRVESAEWIDAPHSETDLLLQRVVGWGLAAAALAAIVHLARVAVYRVTVAADAVRVPGHDVIPLSQIVEVLSHAGGSEMGIEIRHATPGGQASLLQLDRYHVRDLDGIVRAICANKGIPNPIVSADA